MTYTEIKAAIYSWVNSCACRSVIWANQDAPAPARTYITLLISRIAAVGRDYVSPPDSAGTSRVQGNREFTLSLQAFGDSAIQDLMDLRDSLETVSVQQALADSGLAIVEHQQIQDVTFALGSTLEPRAVFDVRFRAGSEIVDDGTGFIQIVEYDGEVEGAVDGSIAFSDTIDAS